MANKKIDASAGPVLVIPEDRQGFTKEKLEALLPRGSSITVDDEVLAALDKMEEDTDLPQELMEEEFMTYSYLLGKGKGLGILQLINAVKFCNLKRTTSNLQSWAIVFPAKYDRLVASGRQIDNHVSMFNTSWLVQEIDKEMAMVVHLQYAGAFHKAMSTQIALMGGRGGVNTDGEAIEVSAMVRHLAAKSVLEIARPPEELKISHTHTESDELIAAKGRQADALEAIVANQQAAFRSGAKTIDVQAIHRRIDKASSVRPDEGLNNV